VPPLRIGPSRKGPAARLRGTDGEGKHPPRRLDDPIGDDAADDIGGTLLEAGDQPAVERHQCERTAIAGKTGQDRRQELGIALAGALELDDQQDPAGDLLEKLREGGDPVGAAGKRDAGQLADRPGRDKTGLAGQPVEALVVKHHGPASAGEPDVAFDRVVMGHCRGKRPGTVLDPPGAPVMQAAMGDRSGREEAKVALRAGSEQQRP
jgi:hypothetical protein